MKSYEEWKKEYIVERNTRKHLHEKQIREVYNEKHKEHEKQLELSKLKQKESEKEAQLKQEKFEKAQLIQNKTNDIAQKCKAEGISSLNLDELEVVAKIADDFLEGKTLSKQSVFSTKLMFKDQAGSNFLLIRKTHGLQKYQISTMNQNDTILRKLDKQLSGISQNTAGTKIASMFTGLSAARHLGEEFAEDFGGGDE